MYVNRQDCRCPVWIKMDKIKHKNRTVSNSSLIQFNTQFISLYTVHMNNYLDMAILIRHLWLSLSKLVSTYMCVIIHCNLHNDKWIKHLGVSHFYFLIKPKLYGLRPTFGPLVLDGAIRYLDLPIPWTPKLVVRFEALKTRTMGMLPNHWSLWYC